MCDHSAAGSAPTASLHPCPSALVLKMVSCCTTAAFGRSVTELPRSRSSTALSVPLTSTVRSLTYARSEQRGAAGCIQYCQRSSHWALSRCCKTENRQGTLSTQQTDSQAQDEARALTAGGYLHTRLGARHGAESARRRGSGLVSAHGGTDSAPHPPAPRPSSVLCSTRLSNTHVLAKSSSRGTRVHKVNHKRQQTVNEGPEHFPEYCKLPSLVHKSNTKDLRINPIGDYSSPRALQGVLFKTERAACGRAGAAPELGVHCPPRAAQNPHRYVLPLKPSLSCAWSSPALLITPCMLPCVNTLGVIRGLLQA